MNHRILTSLSLIALLTAPAQTFAVDVFKGAKPQSLPNSCQSHATILALAAKQDPAFSIRTFSELRELEQEFFNILTDLGSHTKHTNWPKAMEQLTGGYYTVKLRYIKGGIANWQRAVSGETIIASDFDKAIAEMTKSPLPIVLTSVYELEGSKYNSGHIVAILGTIGNGMSSNTRIVAFNGAVKGGDKTKVCTADHAIGDEKYSAGVVDTQDYRLKDYGGDLLLMTVEKR